MDIDFEALLALSPNPYVLLDPSLTIVWMNDAYLRATMRKREAITGRSMFEAFPSEPDSESHRLLADSLHRVLATGEPDEIALIRYDISDPDGSMHQHYWSATHTPLHDAEGNVAHILQHTVDVTELHGLRRLRDETGVVERAQAVQARNRDLSEESERFKTLFEQAPGFVAILAGPKHRFQLANAAYRDLVGRQDLIGKSVAEALPEVVDQGFVGLLDKVRRTATAYVGRGERVVLASEAAENGEGRFLDFVYQPIVTDSGDISGIFVQGHDVTDQIEAEERQKLLISELNHRVKNSLAIVQGLARQSFKAVDGAAEARQTFDARLKALAAAHSLLTEQNWEAATLVDTLRATIEATAGSDLQRFALSGPDLSLGPQAAMSLSMLVHELSTNAIKYGALSEPGGRVSVYWALDDEGDHQRLVIRWSESGGPPVGEPTRQGFGSRLIRRGISAELGGEVGLDFAPEGLRCTIVARLAKGAP